MPIDKETIHVIIEVLTVIFMPMLTYFVKNTAKETGENVKKELAPVIKEVQEDIDKINIKDAVSDAWHQDAERRLAALEDHYKAIRAYGSAQQRITKNIALKLGVDI